MFLPFLLDDLNELRKALSLICFVLRFIQVTMDNGICQVTLSNPDGILTEIQFNGIGNLLENTNVGQTGGYSLFNIHWSLKTYLFLQKKKSIPCSAYLFDFWFLADTGILYGVHQELQKLLENLMCMTVYRFQEHVFGVRIVNGVNLWCAGLEEQVLRSLLKQRNKWRSHLKECGILPLKESWFL